MRYNFYDLSRIPLDHIALAQITCDAHGQAKCPEAEIHHCPWDQSRTQEGRYKRLAWRSVFRSTREQLQIAQQVTTDWRLAA